MSVYLETRKRPDGTVLWSKWVAEVECAGRRLRARYSTKKEAKAQEQAWKRNGAPEGPQAATGASLLAFLEEHAAHLWPALKWRQECDRSVRLFAEALGGDPALGSITTAAIHKAAMGMSTVSKLTVQKHMSALNKLLKHAALLGEIPTAPTMPWPRGVKVEKRREITPEEEARMFAFLREKGQDELLDYLAVSLNTGMRRGELLGAQPHHLVGSTLTLWKTKNGQVRTVHVTDCTRAILERRLPWKLTPATIRYWWDEAKQAIGLAGDRRLTPHSLRHAAATRLLEAGVDIKVVQDFLGHENLATTADTYAHVTKVAKRSAAETLAAINARAR